MHVNVHHVTVAASDLAISAAFYDQVLKPLGWGRQAEFGDEEEEEVLAEAIAYAPPDSALADAPLWLVAATGDPTRGAHIAFQADSRSAVAQLYDNALNAGGTAHQAPRRWEVYRPGYFGAAVRDPDGNLIEFFTDEAG